MNTTTIFYRLALHLGAAVCMFGVSSTTAQAEPLAAAAAKAEAIAEAVPATSAAVLLVEPAAAIDSTLTPHLAVSASATDIAQANQTPPTDPPQAPAPESPQPGAPPDQGDTETDSTDPASDAEPQVSPADETSPDNTAPSETTPSEPTDEASPEDTAEPTTSDPDRRTLGRSTRTGPSYVGVGGNIGIGDGDTALGDGSFAILSKVGITSFLSVRPAVLFSDNNPTILVPVTFDFIPLVTDATEDASGALGFRASPYIGAGTAISTGDNGSVDLLVTGGVDVPITSRFTATASVNVSLFDNPAVGLLLGAGINF